jgi:hypothetical protein
VAVGVTVDSGVVLIAFSSSIFQAIIKRQKPRTLAAIAGAHRPGHAGTEIPKAIASSDHAFPFQLRAQHFNLYIEIGNVGFQQFLLLLGEDFLNRG